MARIRTIKPDFWKHEDISGLSPEACLLAIGILNYADDEGYFNANPKLIEAEIFPLRKLNKKLVNLLEELVAISYIQLSDDMNGKTYGRVLNFNSHQKVNRPYPSKIKHLFSFSESSVNIHGALTDDSLQEKEKEKEKEIVDAYCSITKKKIMKIDSTRRSNVRKFLEDYSTEQWIVCLKKVMQSKFMQTEWTAWDIDWLLKDKNFQKVMQGNYDNNQPKQPARKKTINELTEEEKERYGYF